MDRLRRQADMPHDGDARIDQAPDNWRNSCAAFQFDGLRRPFLNEAGGVPQSSFSIDLVAEERHIGNDERLRGAPHDGCARADDIVDGYRDRGVVTKNDMAHAVADEDHRNPRRIDDAGCRVVVCRHHWDRLATALHLLNLVSGDSANCHRAPPPRSTATC